MPPKNPLEGLPDYDLKRLSADQKVRLHDIINKQNSGTRLNAKDVTDLGRIRKAVKTDKAAGGNGPLDLLSKTLADMKEAFK